MRSRSISSSARPASQRYMITIFPPNARLATNTEWHPVAWKNGTDSKYAFCSPAPGAATGAASDRAAARDDANTRLIRFVQMLRCVPSAPFGRPVVPDV